MVSHPSLSAFVEHSVDAIRVAQCEMGLRETQEPGRFEQPGSFISRLATNYFEPLIFCRSLLKWNPKQK